MEPALPSLENLEGASRARHQVDILSHLDGALDEHTLDAMQGVWAMLEHAAADASAHARAVRARMFWESLAPQGAAAAPVRVVGDLQASWSEEPPTVEPVAAPELEEREELELVLAAGPEPELVTTEPAEPVAEPVEDHVPVAEFVGDEHEVEAEGAEVEESIARIGLDDVFRAGGDAGAVEAPVEARLEGDAVFEAEEDLAA